MKLSAAHEPLRIQTEQHPHHQENAMKLDPP